MVFTTNAIRNTVMPMFGNVSQTCSIIFPWQPWLKIKFSAYMVDYLHPLILWNILEHLIDFKKFHMKDQCAICYGQTQMTEMDGVSRQEEQDIHSDMIFLINLIIIIISSSLQEPISLLWMDIVKLMKSMWWQFSLLQTIVIDVEIKQLL